MKLVTYEVARQSRLGVVEGEVVVDVAGAYGQIPKGRIADAKLAAAAKVLRKLGRPPQDMRELLELGERYRKALGVITAAAAARGKGPKGLLTPLGSARLRAPLAKPDKITCVGLNYADHAREQGSEPPAAPIFFLKSPNTICGPGDPIKLPPNSAQVDYEAEFAVVIGKRGRDIVEGEAHKYIAGYTILHDVSARDMQFGDKQWYRGKSCDTFAPTGPWIVTADEITDPHNLRISLTLNGETLQDSSTSNLIFRVPFLISYLSQSVTWEVGDLISTGTPPGVGVFRKPPVFLKPGDTVSVSVEGIGTLTNPVVGP
ncbi:MAG: fumarylacetoacetate hydrolase family protein [Terriglobia bacterium]|jgi:2-keto-4-pentenoate hydratase/2-oxohepta-3-ene-1,7-dioic acid hydratase in catechol pathway